MFEWFEGQLPILTYRQVKSGQIKTDQVKSEKVKLEKVKSIQVKSGHVQLELVDSGQDN